MEIILDWYVILLEVHIRRWIHCGMNMVSNNPQVSYCVVMITN